MCIIQLQNHKIICYKTGLVNIMIYQMQKKKIQPKYDPDKLFLKTYDYDDGWYTEKKLDDEEESVDLSIVPPLQIIKKLLTKIRYY